MKHYTLKELKKIRDNGAYDISTCAEEELPYRADCIGYSTGMFGINGALFESDGGTLFVIIGRTTNLFRMI